MNHEAHEDYEGHEDGKSHDINIKEVFRDLRDRRALRG